MRYGWVVGAVVVLGGAACGSSPPPCPTDSRAATAVSAVSDVSAAGEGSDGGASSTPAGPTAAPTGTSVEAIALEIERQPDGARYPNYVKESYELGGDGFLDYFAYFGGIPIHMNHTDRERWDAGEHGRRVLETMRSIVATPERLAEVTLLSDGTAEPADLQGVYRVRLERDHSDSTVVLRDRGTRAFALLDAAFSAMLAAFEQSSGRPLRPGDLPQGRPDDVR